MYIVLGKISVFKVHLLVVVFSGAFKYIQFTLFTHFMTKSSRIRSDDDN